MGAMVQHLYSRDEKRRAVEREVKMRERNYPRWVRQGVMTQDFADRQLGVMRAILDDYEVQKPLFPESAS